MVDCVGKSGGLALLWKDPISVTIKSFSIGHIDCIVSYAELTWRFACFYGQPVATLRRFSWDLMRRLNSVNEFYGMP